VTVLDASAVLALILEEAGASRVLKALEAGAELTTANFAEVASRYAAQGASATDLRAMRSGLPVTLVDIDEDLAIRAALMFQATRAAGLSLGDRLCLAQAQRSGQPALTADRAWVGVGDALGIEVEVIR
jgi:ribonuclease VapC